MNLTRRDVLQRACGAFAVAAIPARAATNAAAVSEVTAKLGAYMSEAAARVLPREVMEQAKYHILDTFAAMISGSELAPGKIAIQVCAGACRREGSYGGGVGCGLRGD